MANQLSPLPKHFFFDDNGEFLVGGKLYTYAAGTLTPLASYDKDGVANTNPIVLDARGEADVWLSDAAYKLVLKDSNGVEIWTVDNISNRASTLSITDAGNYYSPDNVESALQQIGAKFEVYVTDPAYGASTVASAAANATAIQAAIDAVYNAGGGVVRFPEGTFTTNTFRLKQNVHIIGAGIDVTVIKQNSTTAPSYGTIYADSESASTNIYNLGISDLTIMGPSATPSFSEFEHLVSWNGVNASVIERVKFLAFRGDGLYLGSSPIAATERHNNYVTVRDCFFEGVNNENRNGISVIDCQSLLIDNCQFANITKSTMPGAIDIEPDAQIYHVIKDIQIQGCSFINCGGTNGGISVYLPDISYSTSPSGFVFRDNYFECSSYSDSGIFFQQNNSATSSRNHDVVCDGNILVKTSRGFRFFGAVNVTFTNNQLNDTKFSPLVAFTDGVKKCINVKISGNTFQKLATDNTSGGTGIVVCDVDYLDILDNSFIDCGKTNGTLGNAIDFNTGTSSYVTISGNSIYNPNSKTTLAFQKEAGHTFTSSSNKYFRNEILGLTNNFQAQNSDYIEQSWSPEIGGTTSDGGAGSGTYTTQTGKYFKNGRNVDFSISLVQTATAAVGNAEISIPVKALGAASQVACCSGWATNGTYTGMVFGLLNTAADVNSLPSAAGGAIRLFRADTGAGFALAAGMTIYLTGRYTSSV